MEMDVNKVYNMDCIEGMKKIKDNSVDSIVTDPPYLLNFMSKKWDKADCIDPSFGHWFAGFTDGEGCFRIHKEKRGKYYACNFQIKLRRDDRKILEYIREQTGVGKVSDLKPYGNSKPCSLYFVGRRDDCIRIADIFLQFPLKAKKKRDFIKWYECLQNWIYRERGDNTLMEQNWREMKKIRKYRESPVPLNKDSYWHYIWGKEALRILKPGGHLLAFSGTRTYHRMVCGLEDAGFEIRDQLDWLFGQGFPKSYNISKGIDKKFGKERKVVGYTEWKRGEIKNVYHKGYNVGHDPITAPATKESRQWEGWGTALKPAHEPIVLARKPFKGNVTDNVLKNGTGGINIDGCRIDLKGENNPTGSAKRVYKNNQYTEEKSYGDNKVTPDKGRFPSNVILDEEASKMLDEQSGILDKAGNVRDSNISHYNASSYELGLGKRNPKYHNDSGGASRFFYCAKAHHSERNAGLEDLELVSRGRWNKGGEWTDETTDVKNNIATLKPINLMRYLIRLVTPPKGTVVDPFAGSGTTGCACVIDGFNYILFEKRERFAKEIIPRRIDYWSKSKNWKELNEHKELPKPNEARLDKWL